MPNRVLFVAALLGACGTSDDAGPIEHTYDACEPITLVAAAPTEAQARAISDAPALWGRRTGDLIDTEIATAIEVRFEKAALQFRGLYDDHASVIYINNGITDEATLSIVIAHELGHAFGLAHVPAGERRSVMNPGNVTVLPNAEDQVALQALWGACP